MLVNTVVLRILINDLKREMRIFVLNGLKPFGVFVLNCDGDDARLRFSLSLDTLSMRVHPFLCANNNKNNIINIVQGKGGTTS